MSIWKVDGGSMGIEDLTPEAVQGMAWTDLEPHFDHLAQAPLRTDSLDGWLTEWSALEAVVWEATATAELATARDTTDADAEATHLRLAGEITPRVEEQHIRLTERLLELDEIPPDLAPTVQAARDQRRTFRVDHAAAQAELATLSARYDRIAGSLTAEWDGATVPVNDLARHFGDPDRTVRERAVRGWLDAYVERRDEIAKLFDAQYRLRQEVATSAGFANYLDYDYRAKSRPYSPDHARAFHDMVERTVVPVLARRRERQRRSLNLDMFAIWDTVVDLSGRPPLRPATTGAELLATTQRILQHIHPEFGEQFALMMAEGRIDIDARPGKAPGGFCTTLDCSQRPFIFGTRLGTHDDVTLLLHEGGHALHAFAAYAHQPLVFQRYPGAEMNELVAMSMDLLGSRYLARRDGGFYTDVDAHRAEIRQLDRILSVLTWIAWVDAFQVWVYTSGQGHDRDARDAAWVELAHRFDPVTDWRVYPEGLAARWYQQSLIFVAPLYMIEYGIAQFGALRIWRDSLADERGTVDALRHAMSLGNTRFLPELFAAAGIAFDLDLSTTLDLIDFIVARLADLEH